jgi:hypothetical protein
MMQEVIMAICMLHSVMQCFLLAAMAANICSLLDMALMVSTLDMGRVLSPLLVVMVT